MLGFLLVALGANVGITYATGFKQERTFGSAVAQAVESVAVGIVAATVMLLVLTLSPIGPLA